MIFVFAGIGLALVGTILVGSLVFGIEPRRNEAPVQGFSSSAAEAPMFATDKEAP